MTAGKGCHYLLLFYRISQPRANHSFDLRVQKYFVRSSLQNVVPFNKKPLVFCWLQKIKDFLQ